MPNITKDQITGTISLNALESVIGRTFAKMAISYMKNNEDNYIPNFEILERGDIILSQHCLESHELKNAPVVRAQKSLLSKNFDSDACVWGHAMVYIGNMFIAESQPFFMSGWFPKSGLRAVPITAHSTSRKFIICRHNKAAGREDVIAHYATLRCIAGATKYPLWRSMRSALKDKAEKVRGDSATCSEFALECLAIAGGCMVDAWTNFTDGKECFYPADFYSSIEFNKIEMKYLKLER